MLFRDPRMFSALLFAVGLGLTMWYGVAWYELPTWSASEVEQSTALNLGIDLSRRGPHLQPDAAGLELLRAQVRAEVEGEIRRERQQVQRPFAIGLALLVISLSHLLKTSLAARRSGRASG